MYKAKDNVNGQSFFFFNANEIMYPCSWKASAVYNNFLKLVYVL